jgi:hypothetical protein
MHELASSVAVYLASQSRMAYEMHDSTKKMSVAV